MFLTLHRRLSHKAEPAADPMPRAVPGIPPSVRLPELHTFADVVRWVIEELGAMCPSPQRLARYLAHPSAPGQEDIRYHLELAGCTLCRAEQTANP